MTEMAGFFGDLGKRLSETANVLGKKAEDTLEIQKRKSDIRFLSRANDRDYMVSAKSYLKSIVTVKLLIRIWQHFVKQSLREMKKLQRFRQRLTASMVLLQRIQRKRKRFLKRPQKNNEVQTISGSCSSYLWNGSLSEEPRREMCKTR